MNIKKKIEALEELRDRIRSGKGTYMCVELRVVSISRLWGLIYAYLSKSQREEIIADLWEDRLIDKLSLKIHYKKRPNSVWYNTGEDRHHRIENIDRTIKRLQESLEIRK